MIAVLLPAFVAIATFVGAAAIASDTDYPPDRFERVALTVTLTAFGAFNAYAAIWAALHPAP